MHRNTPAELKNVRERLVEKAQLLEEEKWILKALRKIRAQRNRLRIERLELERMKAKIIKQMNEQQQTSHNQPPDVMEQTPNTNEMIHHPPPDLTTEPRIISVEIIECE